MERKEAYEQIKKLGLQEECKKKYGKNFTQCKTSELKAVIKEAKIGVGAEIKTTKAAPKTVTKTEEPKDSFLRLITALAGKHLLLKSEIDWILG